MSPDDNRGGIIAVLRGLPWSLSDDGVVEGIDGIAVKGEWG